MSVTLCRTLCYCIIILGGLSCGRYITDIEKRMTNLEDRYENSLVLPRPLPIDIFINRPVRGDDSK